nr:hypothetical protein [Mesorhizobium sp. AR02]
MDSIADEECREDIDRIVEVAEKHGSAEKHRGRQEGKSQPRILPEHQSEKEWRARMAREKEVAAKCE